MLLFDLVCMETDHQLVRMKMRVKIRELVKQYPFRTETITSPNQKTLEAYA